MFGGRVKSAATTMISVLLALSTQACGGRAEDAPFVVRGDTSTLFGSGTRLKAHYLDGGGGARYFRAFHDTDLDIECRFVETSPDEYRCLPVNGTSTFSDSTCSMPTTSVGSLCANDPEWTVGAMFTVGSTDCSARVGAFSLVDQIQLESTFSLEPSGACRQSPGKLLPTDWTMKPEPLTQFVHASASFVGQANETQFIRVTADDGAYSNVELVAGNDHEPCTPVQALGRCVPGPFTQRAQSVYADADCTDDASIAQAYLRFAQRCTGVRPQYLVESKAESCKLETTVYRLGDQIFDPYSSQGSCSPLSESAPAGFQGNSFYRVGQPASIEIFPVFHEASIGSGELSVAGYTDSAGGLIQYAPSGEFIDTGGGAWKLRDGTPCRLLTDPNGQRRCVPKFVTDGTLLGSGYFSDASCAQSVYEYTPSCDGSKPRYLIDGNLSLCSSTFDQAYVVDDYLGPVYAIQNDVCVLYEHGERHFVKAGESVSADHFPLVADITDP